MEFEVLFTSLVPEEEGEFGEEHEVGRSSDLMTMSHSCFATNTFLIMYAHIGWIVPSNLVSALSLPKISAFAKSLPQEI